MSSLAVCKKACSLLLGNASTTINKNFTLSRHFIVSTFMLALKAWCRTTHVYYTSSNQY